MNKAKGFTIVELLIVIVVIGILATVSIVAYNGVSAKARDSVRQQDVRQVHKLIEIYYAKNGEYPKTTSNFNWVIGSATRMGQNCTIRPTTNVNRTDKWVPGLDTPLPQSRPNTGKGPGGATGCYMYVSDGQKYIISAWGNIESGPQTDTMYRRLGFREVPAISSSSTNGYYCNHTGIGGGSTYSATNDYYKYSYTISNVTDCNETPPAGA